MATDFVVTQLPGVGGVNITGATGYAGYTGPQGPMGMSAGYWGQSNDGTSIYPCPAPQPITMWTQPDGATITFASSF